MKPFENELCGMQYMLCVWEPLEQLKPVLIHTIANWHYKYLKSPVNNEFIHHGSARVIVDISTNLTYSNPVNIAIVARNGPVPARCCHQRYSCGSFLAVMAIFTGNHLAWGKWVNSFCHSETLYVSYILIKHVWSPISDRPMFARLASKASFS